jgi:hypothetical protein
VERESISLRICYATLVCPVVWILLKVRLVHKERWNHVSTYCKGQRLQTEGGEFGGQDGVFSLVAPIIVYIVV